MGTARLNRAWVGVLVLCVVSFFLVACSKNKPSDDAVRQSLVERFPAFVEIKDFSVEEAQNVGNDVEPVWRSRIKATAVISADTFEEIGRAEENPETKARATFIKPIRKAGEKVPVFGKATSSLYQGAWKSELELDGSPEQGLGRLKDSIAVDSATTLIIIGSQEEKAWSDELVVAQKKQQEATDASLRAQKIEEIRTANAEKEERERLAFERMKKRVIVENVILPAGGTVAVPRKGVCSVDERTKEQQKYVTLVTGHEELRFVSQMKTELQFKVWFYDDEGGDCLTAFNILNAHQTFQ